MEDPAGRRPASFKTQANALFRKNIAFQKRNMKTNCCLISFPIILCLLFFLIQQLIDSELNNSKNKCGCTCIENNSDGSCKTRECGIQYSTLDQVGTCAIPSPPEWAPMLQVPRSEYRAVSRGSQTFSGLPEESCRATQTCPAVVLFTGNNRTLGERVLENFFTIFTISSLSDASSVPDNATLGTGSDTETVNFIEPAFLSERPVYTVQSQCGSDSKYSVPFKIGNFTINETAEVECVQSSNIWRGNSSGINDELFKGYKQSNIERQINEIMTAYDFLNSNQNNFNVNIWYNSTYKDDTFGSASKLVRVTRLVNLVSNAYLQLMRGNGVEMQFEFTKEMPKAGNKLTFDFSSLLGPLFFTWIIGFLFPVLLTYLVLEKQQKLRIMMKMHGLGDGPYWIISYCYFLLISLVYVLFLVIFGSVIDLKFFTENDYSLQFVFYFAFINLQIALAFLFASVFSNVKSAQVSAYVYIFGTGLLAAYLLETLMEDLAFSRSWITVMEILPTFSLYRGLYEFADYATLAQSLGTSGMTWKDLNDDQNGLGEVLIIIFIEWVVLLPLAYYLDQLSSLGSKIRNDPLFFLKCFHKKQKTSLASSSKRRMLSNQRSKITIDVDKPDVIQERELVERLVIEPSADYAIVCDNLKKVYPGRDGNQSKLAVQGLSLALQRGECFGMLGPNGAGKTSFISMMIGLTPPTSGNAYVEQLSIQADMDKIYTSMGVCPQHDMLWEMLTGREHLMFYGRLKNLKGSALIHAVEESLRSVNLLGVGDKQSRKYSGGMKRRLSVAISLIGDPKVVYMDEPSTGLDPASRNNLWNVVKRAKQNRAIILTTHSMEEAEVLCDRLGIFVGGNFQCIGNPNQCKPTVQPCKHATAYGLHSWFTLKTSLLTKKPSHLILPRLKVRYGGDYVFTMTTSSSDEKHVEDLVRRLSSSAKKIYHISGTQKFEIPKQDVKIAGVFQAVEDAKKSFGIQAWGLTDTTLEDVFIKVADE